jgi:hypothetical protein
MLSSKDNEGVWKHDANQQRNSFYGLQSPSSLTVVSNEDPSAVKIFKSISLESNQKDWSVQFSSNDEYEDSNSQSSKTIKNKFIDKEGFKYLDVPRSAINSTSNISPCEIFPIDSDVPVDPVLEGFNYYQYPVSVDPNMQMSTPSGNLLSVVGGTLVSFIDFTSGSFNEIKLTSVYPSENTVYLDLSLNAGIVQNSADPESSLSELVNKINLFIENQNFVETPAEINGDQMRGPYLKTYLDIKTSRPLELHAINIDYEFSKLDKRLTQNS